MSQLCVPIPPLAEARTIEVTVTIDGFERQLRYRVETLAWPTDAPSRADALRAFIDAHGEEWMLVQIGTPTEEQVPVLFRLHPAAEPPPPLPA